MIDGSLDFGHFVPTQRERVADRVRAATGPDRALDADIARALGYIISASTGGPLMMRKGSVATWDLPTYTATPESRTAAIAKLCP